MTLNTPARLVLLVGIGLASAVDAAENGVRRVTRSGSVEVAPHGPIKRQNSNEDDADVNTALLQEEELDNSRCQISKGAIIPKAFATASSPEGGELALRTYNNVAGAQECALLCASNANCTAFFHVKDSNHPLHKQCTLTKWDGRSTQFKSDDCCDAGFPCSTDDLTAPLKMENQVLREREASEIKRLNNALAIRQKILIQKDTDSAIDKNEIKRLNHALDIRQRIFVEKDMNMVAEKQVEARLLKEEERLAVEVEALNSELQSKSYYVYGLSSALALTMVLLFGFVAYVAWGRWMELDAQNKPNHKAVQGNNAQLIAQAVSHR